MQVIVVHGDPQKPSPIIPGGRWDRDDFETIELLKKALSSLETGGGKYSFSFLCNHETLLQDLKQARDEGRVDLVLQLCDEGWYNHPRMECHVISYLEMMGIPFTGSGSTVICQTFDKQAILQVAKSIGIPTPKSVYLVDREELASHGLAYPVLIKPNSTDGSFGITMKNIAHNEQELNDAFSIIRREFGVTGAVLVQEYLPGPDINVALVGNEPTVLPITEEDYSALPKDWPKICGFENKWDETSPYWKIVTRPTTALSQEAQKNVADHSKALFHRLKISDYARLDWRLDRHGQPVLLEANPNCGWCEDGHRKHDNLLRC